MTNTIFRRTLLDKLVVGCAVGLACLGAFADDSGVSLAIEGPKAVITVAPNVVDAEGTVYLAYGTEDYGDQLARWPKRTIVTSNLQPAGGTFECALIDRRQFPNMTARAFVSTESGMALVSQGGAFINLKETPSLDRRYEFRFRHTAAPSGTVNLFGGVSRDGAVQSFQVYGTTVGGSFGWICYFGQGTGENVQAFRPEKDVIYDLRMDVAEGEQIVSWKRAEETDYTEAGRVTLTALGYTGNLWLFARSDRDANICGNCAIYNYKVTELSTGNVLKNLVPSTDDNGVAQMLDVESGTTYANANSSGSFAVERVPGEVVGCSAVATYNGVRAAMKGNRLTLDVDDDISDGRSALYLVWGASDAGTDASAWDHMQCVLDPIPDEGQRVQVDLSTFDIPSKSVLRALVVPRGDLVYCFGSKSGACISLGETVGPDRQFDMRINASSSGAVFIGGLDSGKNHIFQLYYSGSSVQVWFGDKVAHDVFAKEQSDDSQYDVRIILQEGDQRAYWKPATNEVYELGASGTLPSFQSGLNLAICGRGEGSGFTGSAAARFGRFTETEISTGRVIRDLVPVKYNGDSFVYDLVTNKKLPLANTDFAFHTTIVGEVPILGYACCATDLFPAPKGGMMILVY